MIRQFNDFLNLIFGGLLTFRPTLRRAMDAIASHFFFTMKTFQKLLVCVLNVILILTYMMQYIKCIFPPTFIEYELRFQSGDGKILPLIKQKCIEPSTNMKQVRYGFCLHEINR